jgi:peptidoglycan/xylan/chitin deacetylase (PgdA/CDA1 family)
MKLKLLAVIPVLALAVLCGLVVWSYSDVVMRIPTGEKVVALTYDDGPNPPYTWSLLELLQEHGVKATFFLKGRNVEAFPRELRNMVYLGHEIANHGYSHRHMVSFSRREMLEEVARTNAAIREVLEYEPELFRPPYGLQGPGLKRALEDLNMTSVLMTAWGSDWEVTDPERIAEAVLRDVEPGGIILLHDGHGDVDDPSAQDSRAATVAATRIIIEELQARGYRFLTLGQMLHWYGR